MFKSSQNLRLAAEMRALARVATPWREARTTWFDGTPESIEARIAATDRVLTHARSGYTAAHLALTTEAETARRELLAAKHRLLADFLDDGARAFKGSKRVADMYVHNGPILGRVAEKDWSPADPDWDEWHHDCVHCGHEVHMDDDVCENCGEHPADLSGEYAWMSGIPGPNPFARQTHDQHFPIDDDPDMRFARRTAAGAGLTGGDVWHDHPNEQDWYDDDYADTDYDADPYELRRLRRERAEEWPDDDPARYSSLKAAAAAFVAAQGGIADRDELAFRAARHIDNQTGQWPRTAAAQARRAFVAAVVAEAPRLRRPRTAAAPAVVADFGDQLLFDS